MQNILRNKLCFGLGATLAVGVVSTSAAAYEVSRAYSGGDKSLVAYEARFEASDELSAQAGVAPLEMYRFHAEGKATVFAFKHEKELVYGLANALYREFPPGVVYAEGTKPKRGEIEVEVRILGSTRFKKNYGFERELPTSKDTWVKEVTIAEQTFAVGPVPVTVSLGASAAAKMDFSGDINMGVPGEGFPSAEPYVRLKAGPRVDIGAVASARAGVKYLAAVGVKGTVNIYGAGLMAEATYWPNHNALVAQVAKEETGIHGKLDAYVELLFAKYSKTIARFGDSTPRRDVLWSSQAVVDKARPITGTIPAPSVSVQPPVPTCESLCQGHGQCMAFTPECASIINPPPPPVPVAVPQPSHGVSPECQAICQGHGQCMAFTPECN
jgi:hypothetical protein